MIRRNIGLLLAGTFAGGAFIAGVLADEPALRVALKTLPVLSMAVWLAPWQTHDARLVAFGLLLSAIGDACLEASPDLFLAGLVAFLAAHLAYITAFLQRSRKAALGAVLPVAVFGISIFLWLRPHLGAMMLPVLGYVVVICTMMWRAWALLDDKRVARPVAWTAALGATSFGISDTLVAYNRFIAPVLALQVLLMLLYWAGQWGIAASSGEVRRAT